MITRFGCGNYGMGDLLLLTSICKYFPNQFTIEIQKSVNRFSIFFDKIAEVEFIEDMPYAELVRKGKYLPSIGRGHYATRQLRNYFGDKASLLDNRPLVLYTDMESEAWVDQYLKDKPNPAIIAPMCSPNAKGIRGMKEDLTQSIIEQLQNNNVTPILCLSSSYEYNLKSKHIIKDLCIKKYICLMRRVGLYFGANTGDMHLAVAVGALVNTFQPKFDPKTFNPEEWCYNHPTIKYYDT